jgi:hypothetical protein
MSDNYLDSSKVGQLAGAILARRKKTTSDEKKKAIGATILLETLNAFKNREKQNLVEETNNFKQEADLILKDYEERYNQNNNTRNEINLFNSVNRENFLNKKVIENYNTSDFRRTIGKSYDEMEANPALREQLFEWGNKEKERLIEYYNKVQEDPFVTHTFSSLSKPVLDELNAKLDELEDDPTKTSLLLKGLNKIFLTCLVLHEKQAQLANAVTKAERKRIEQEKFSNSIND